MTPGSAGSEDPLVGAWLLDLSETGMAARTVTGPDSDTGTDTAARNDTGTRPAPDPSARPTLVLGADGSLSGSAGVNRYVGHWERADADGLVLGVSATTMMAGPAEAMEREAAVLAALTSVRSAYPDPDAAGDLQLRDESGIVVLRCRPARRDLLGSAWRAAGINNGHGGVETTVDTPRATISFGTDGRVSGSTGVNRFSADYRTVRDRLVLGPLAVTRRAGPPSLMELESAFLAALAAATRWHTDGTSTTLRDDEGATQVVLVEDSPGQER